MKTVKFSEIEYKRPDMEALKKALEEATAKVLNAKSYEEVRDAYYALQEREQADETMSTLAYVRNTINMKDEFYDKEIKWLQEEFANTIPQYNAYEKALTQSKFRPEFEAEFGAQLLRTMDASLMTSDEKIIPETIRTEQLGQEYSKTTASAVTDFRGEECNFYGLLKHMQSTDRAERKEAFEAWAALYEKISPELEAQYGEMVKLRNEMALKMGFKSYTDMAYIDRNRFDYKQEDAAKFREQVREIITPAVEKLRKAQQEKLGIDKLYFYDEELKFPDGNAAPIGSAKELVDKAQRMYR